MGNSDIALNLAGSYPRYVPTGHLVYGVDDGTLRAVRFDADELEVTSDPIPVVEGVNTKASGAANFGVAQNGSLVYVPSAAGAGSIDRTLVWVDRQGQEEVVTAEPRPYYTIRLSPDGTRVALDVRPQTFFDADVWIYDFAGPTSLFLLTDDPGLDGLPIWTPDGLRVIWEAIRLGTRGLFWRAADRTGQEEQLTTSPNQQLPHDVSPDGTLLVFTENSPETGQDIGVLSLTDEEHEIEWLLNTPFSEFSPALSPDGRWMAYTSDQTGLIEVYVKPFPNVEDGRTPVSQGGGNWPVWAPGGGELFYRTPEGLMMVAFETEPSFRVRTRALLFEETGVYNWSVGHTYDIAPDGQRFLMIKEGGGGTDDAPAPQIILVQNWFDELQRLVPSP